MDTNKRVKNIKGQYKHLNKIERQEIAYYLKQGYSLRAIGELIGRPHTTISRELKRNARVKRTVTKPNGSYEAKLADHKSYYRRRWANYRGKKIHLNKPLRQYIKNKLKSDWSPEVISGRMKKDKLPLYASKSAIYEYIYSPRGEPLAKYLHCHRYRPKRQKGSSQTKKFRIPERTGIEKRPIAINNNQEYGHYEEDTIVSGKKHHSKVSVAVIYERKAKAIMLQKIPNLRPDIHLLALDHMVDKLNISSITFDNGVENTKHVHLRRKYSIETFFCDPYSSWQKPGVENVNRLIRRYIKKGTDISQYSNEYIRKIQNIINNRPRKSLNYSTPLEVMIKHNLLKSN